MDTSFFRGRGSFRTLGFLLALGACGSEVAGEAPGGAVTTAALEGAPSPRYDEALFKATHNSYSGNERGSLVEQLDLGVRFVELDLHDNDYTTIGDYRIGHDRPGHQTAFGPPNPSTTLLRDWLTVVARWSEAHPTHAPITLGLDVKDDLTDNASAASGNLGALNATLGEVFGGRLLPARDVPAAWPTVDALRGRVLVVLSGHEGTRRAYRFDPGATASVAMNARGEVVEVHASARGELWVWTGVFDERGAVRWRRHARFGKGTSPAVLLSEDGRIVELHEAGKGTIAYRVGSLDPRGDVVWRNEMSLGVGTRPSVRAPSRGLALRAIFVASGRNVVVEGAFEPSLPIVTWSADGARPTSEPRFDPMRDERDGRWIGVRTGIDGLAPASTLLYATADVPNGRVRYEQLAFVEHQKGGDALLQGEARFYAASADQKEWLADARRAGRVVRAWQLDAASQWTDPPVSFPATDFPKAAWYTSSTRERGAQE